MYVIFSEGEKANNMIDHKPSSLKSVSGKPHLKYFLLGISLLVIVIAISLNTSYFIKTVPVGSHSSANSSYE